MIEETLMTLILTAIAVAPAVTGMVQVIKKYVDIEGMQIIVVAILTGVLLLGSVAYVFTLPLAESLLVGVLSGFASIGAFETVNHVRN